MAVKGSRDKSKISEIKIVCIGGLPRSGSTWLGAILAQNPRFYITPPQSPFVELLWRNYSLWHEPNWRGDLLSRELLDMKISYLRSIGNAYFGELTDKSVVIDVRRHWNSIKNMEMYFEVFGVKPKVVCPVRNVEDIVASFIRLFEKNGRVWSDSNLSGNLFSTPYNLLVEAYNSDYLDCLHLVGYDDLLKDTDTELEKIYQFIGESSYSHDVSIIKASSPCESMDSEYGLVGLHEVYPAMTKSITVAKNVLTNNQLSAFSELTFWGTSGV